MNENDFVFQMDKIVNLTKNKNSKYIFIIPWISTSDDPLSKLKHEDKINMMKKYSFALKNYTKRNNYIFVDPNEYLEQFILKNKTKYMVDYIHPNYKEGIELYSESIFINEK